MGYYEETFARLSTLYDDLDETTAEGAIDIYDELKRLRRDICRNPDTRRSYLVPRVTRVLRKARAVIAVQKAEVVHDIQIVKRESQRELDAYLQVCHAATIIFAVITFYVLILSTGRM